MPNTFIMYQTDMHFKEKYSYFKKNGIHILITRSQLVSFAKLPRDFYGKRSRTQHLSLNSY